MGSLRVGDPLDKSTDIGAIVARVQLERIGSLVERGIAEGASCYQAPYAARETGFFYPPTLVTEVETSSVLVREEIFGPVVTSSTFRTSEEAVALANDTRYGLAASVWSENMTRALAVAAAAKAGVVWVNSANQFDAAAGFGGYRESGYGREGGREGMLEYLVEKASRGAQANAATIPTPALIPTPVPEAPFAGDGVDRTAKLYIGGKQARPDSGYSYAVRDTQGKTLGFAPLGGRKDVRNAVEAARKAGAWSSMTGHARAQVVYYLAENLAARKDAFTSLLAAHTCCSAGDAAAEVERSVRALFRYAALADKVDGRVHSTVTRNVTLAMNEPWGVIGIVCPDAAPLAGLIALIAPAIALGNRVVAVTSRAHPLVAADVYAWLETSDVPGGVVNLVSGPAPELTRALAGHQDVDALWYAGEAAGLAAAEAESAGNLKPVWASAFDAAQDVSTASEEFARRALQVKNIWVPYGD